MLRSETDLLTDTTKKQKMGKEIVKDIIFADTWALIIALREQICD